MIVASLLTVGGFFGAAYVTQTRGLRLGGTIVIPTLTVYALRDFLALPVFLASAVIGYVLLAEFKERTLIYGRDEFIAALAVGTLIPLGLFLFVEITAPTLLRTHPIVFIGSILPGLAAFNFQQTKPEYRLQDLRYTAGLLIALLVLGILLVNPLTARTIGHLTPPVLFAATSDIATFRHAVVPGILVPNIEVRPILTIFLTAGFLLGEYARRRHGVRLGLISLALLAIFALASSWLIVLFIPALLIAYLTIHFLHRHAMLYGRVLICIGCGSGVLVVLLLAATLPVVRGFSALFVGVIAGVDAYNLHATPPVERRQSIPLALAIFTILLFLTRSIIPPTPRGVLQTVTLLHLALASIVVVGGVLIAERARVPKPSDDAVRSASILSGGDGA